MEVRVIEQENGKKDLVVEIPQEELEPRFNKLYKKYQPSIVLEGFRKGKVPIGLIKKLYGKAIEKEVIEETVQETYPKAIEETNLKVISPPKLDDFSYEPEKGLVPYFFLTDSTLICNFLFIPAIQNADLTDKYIKTMANRFFGSK